MNIREPLRHLGPVSVGELIKVLPAPEDSVWDQGSFRNEEIASGAHEATFNLVRRHEWFNRVGVPDISLDEAIALWADSRAGQKPYKFQPCKQVAITTLCSIYEFPISPELDSAIDTCVAEGVRSLARSTGAVLRSIVTALPPGQSVYPHRDGGLTTRFAHRIHIPLIGHEGTVYKIGGHRLTMQAGQAYDFNNRWIHSVENVASTWRINLIVDYLENSSIRNPWARYGWRP